MSGNAAKDTQYTAPVETRLRHDHGELPFKGLRMEMGKNTADLYLEYDPHTDRKSRKSQLHYEVEEKIG